MGNETIYWDGLKGNLTFEGGDLEDVVSARVFPPTDKQGQMLFQVEQQCMMLIKHEYFLAVEGRCHRKFFPKSSTPFPHKKGQMVCF